MTQVGSMVAVFDSSLTLDNKTPRRNNRSVILYHNPDSRRWLSTWRSSIATSRSSPGGGGWVNNNTTKEGVGMYTAITRSTDKRPTITPPVRWFASHHTKKPVILVPTSPRILSTTTVRRKGKKNKRGRPLPRAIRSKSVLGAIAQGEQRKARERKIEEGEVAEPPPFHPDESSFAAVPHGEAYVKAMEGFHGKTLQKAKREGKGKDDPLFDPFMEDALMEQQLLQEEEEEAMAAEAAAKEGELIEEDEEISQEGDFAEDEEEEDEEEEDDQEEEDEHDGVASVAKSTDNLTEEELQRVMYNVDGSIRRKASQKAILKAGSPSGGKFAIIEMAGTQFKVTDDDLLIVHRLKPVNTYSVGSIHSIPQVLLVGTTHLTLVGIPYVPQARVHVMVEEITKGKKVIIFKKRRRKHSQRKRGFRRDVTMLRILDIEVPEQYAQHDHTPRIEPDLKRPRQDPRKRFEKNNNNDEGEEGEEQQQQQQLQQAAA